MLNEVLMPKLGQTMENGTIEKWHKSEGDNVERGEVLFDVTTDKATLEVEAYAKGVLRKIVVQEGETVPCNHLVAVVGDADEELPDIEGLKQQYAARAGSSADAASEATPPPPEEAPIEKTEGPVKKFEQPAETPLPAPAIPAASRTGRIMASPRAKKIAKEQKVPLSVLTGSGPGGRIVEKDLRAYIEDIGRLRMTPAAREIAYQTEVDLRNVKPAKPESRISKEDVQRAAFTAQSAAPAIVPGAEIPVSAMRRVIAERMTISKQTTPHFYVFTDIDMGEAIAARKRFIAAIGEKISITDMLISAAGRALAESPAVNVRWENGRLFANSEVSIGLAVAVPDGLFVPVIRNADRKNLLELARERKALVKKALGNKLTPDDYAGGSITLSNLGMYCVDYFLPIINPPQSCILGTGRTSERVVVRNGGIHVRPIMTVGVGADHRAIDGVLAAKFMKTFKDLLEVPQKLMPGIE